MSSKKLILFTVNFPYSNTEVFLYDELDILSDLFNSIVITPAIIKSHKHIALKNNITIDPSLYDKSLKNIISGISGLFIVIKDILDKDNNVKIFSKDFKTNLIYIIRGIRLLGWYKHLYRQSDTIEEYYYFYWSNSDAYGASLIKRLINPKLVYILRAHGGDLYLNKEESRHLPFRKSIYLYCNHVFPISQNGFNYLYSNYPFLRNKITIARLGIKCDEQNINNIMKNDDTINIVSCSFDRPLKRIWLIRDLIIFLARRAPKKIIWTHIGIEPETFRKKYIPRELPDNCKMKSKGILNKSQILKYYRETSPEFFVNLSVTEGIPVTIMEALCSSIPVIATDVGGTSEIVDNSVGLLVDKDINIDQLASLLLNKNKEVKKMRKNARKRALEMADAKKNYKNFAEKIITLRYINE